MSVQPRVLLVAVPLMARSGVYRSTHDLVRAAHAAGLSWSAIIGMRPSAAGDPVVTPGVREVEFAARGRAGVREIRGLIESAPEVRDCDVIVTLITQSDVAMSGVTKRGGPLWVAWVRGKPWPAKGEQNVLRRLLLRSIESRALKAADEVWATTPVLASEFDSARRAEIIPAGIGAVERLSWGEEASGPLVWAGRVDVDKRPELFAQIVERTGHPGRAFGEGPLLAALSSRPVPGLAWEGWKPAADLWTGASLFVGTSAREAFGRSAVEAAAAGVPVIIAADYGAAPLLVTDPQLRRHCVIESDDPDRWARAVRELLSDDELRGAVSEHVYANAQTLTIEASVRRAAERLEQLWSERAR